MVKRRIVKKGITAMAVMSMMASIVPKGPLFLVKAEEKAEASKTGSNVSADALNVDVDFYDYNITTYQGKDVTNKIALNDYMLEKFTSEGIDEKNVFLFGGDRQLEDTGVHNVWTGAGKGPYQGIVSKELAADGSLQFNNAADIYGVDMFPDEGDNRLDGIVDSYYDANFQFLDEDGTYIFDSDQFCASGLRKNAVGTGSAIDIDFNKYGPEFGSGTGSKGHTIGFFPFNTITTIEKEDGTYKNSANELRHHMFGMKMELDFYMPEDGKIGTKSNPDEKKDMVFSFSGDDDVWVYIDGKLALDLGGIHDIVSGSINFATGEVKSTANESKISHNITNIYEQCGIKKDAYSEHTLTMFYLERGEYDSNCKITFNLPSLVKTDDIAITKRAEGVPEDKKENYAFQLLYGYGEKKNNIETVYKGEYKVYKGDQEIDTRVVTGAGIIYLAADETAVVSKEVVIEDLKNKNTNKKLYYKVKELINNPQYETEWGTTGMTADKGSETSGSGTETAVLTTGVSDEENTIIFTNKYKKWTSFTLEKELANDIKNGDKFEFVVKIGDKKEHVVLAAGEKKTWDKISPGTTYEIQEIVTGGCITGTGIYTTPDVTVDGFEQAVGVEKNTATQEAQNIFVVSGSVLQEKEDGAETKVLYTNNVKEEPVPTPTTTPTETPTMTPTETPTTTSTQKPTPTPKPTPKRTPSIIIITPTETPAVTETPKAEPTNTPAVTETPDVEPTKTPAVTETPKVEPTKTPDVTEEPIKEPTATPVIIEEPTQLPLNPIGPSGEETAEPEETKTPTDVSTETPVVTETPAPTPIPAETPTVIEDPSDLPNAPVTVDEDTDDGADEEEDGYDEETEIEDEDIDDSEDDVEIIDFDDVPNELPQTGGLGKFLAQKDKGIFAVIAAVFVSGIAMGIIFIRRKRTR